MNAQAYVTWNLRGANNTASKFLVRKLVESNKPAMLCLQETKCLTWRDNSVKALGMGSNIGWADSPSQGLSGGLLTVWNSEVFSVSEIFQSSNWLMIKGRCILDGKFFTCFNIYSPQGTHQKRLLWDELSIRIQGGDLLTLVLGDFNAVRFPSERLNCVYKKAESKFFNDFIQTSGLFEVQIVNSCYTWYGHDCKKSRLDRFLVTSDWFLLGTWTAVALNRGNSDHRPLVLKCDSTNWGPKPFKFFNSWLEEDELVSLLRISWENGKGISLNGKLKNLKTLAKDWNKHRYGRLDERIKSLEDSQENEDERNNLSLQNSSYRKELDHLYKVKSSMLCQKARLNWQLKGERNTRFFHRAISIRKCSNNIHCVTSNGHLYTKPVEIKRIFKQHFEALLTSKHGQRVFLICKRVSYRPFLMTCREILPKSSPWLKLRRHYLSQIVTRPLGLTELMQAF